MTNEQQKIIDAATNEQKREGKIFARDYKKYAASFASAVALTHVHAIKHLKDEEIGEIILSKSMENFMTVFKETPNKKFFEMLADAYCYGNKEPYAAVRDDIERCIDAILSNDAARARLLKEGLPRVQ